MIQTVAALGHFGLFEFQGGGENRAARLTDLALRILLDKQPVSSERDQLIQQVALTPRIHAELWQRWQAALPSDATLETYLVRDRGFSESGARDLMAEYKATIAFAKLGQPSYIAQEQAGEAADKSDKREIEVGDLVQVEIDGALALERPVRVRAIQEYEGRSWVFVEGSETGIPLEQLILEQKGGDDSPPPTITAPRLPLPQAEAHRRPPQREGWSEERLLDDAGEEIFISYKGEPSIARYEFIRDFLNFKLSRLKKPGERRQPFIVGDRNYEVRAVPLADRWLVRVFQDEMPVTGGVSVTYDLVAQKPGIDLVGERMEGERQLIERNIKVLEARQP
jgi:hypothetical protein